MMVRKIRSFHTRKVSKLKEMSQRPTFGKGQLCAFVQPGHWRNRPGLTPLSFSSTEKLPLKRVTLT